MPAFLAGACETLESLRVDGERRKGMLYFNQLMFDGSLRIHASELTRWQQGDIIPTQVLQAYWDEGLPFLPEAPITAMRLATFKRKLEELAQGHSAPSVRQLAEKVLEDISVSISGFDRAGKPDPRRRPKTRMEAPRYQTMDSEKIWRRDCN